MINVIVVMCIRKEVNNFLTMRICYIKASHSLLEPYEGKLSCTVLRGESPREGADLLDPDLSTIAYNHMMNHQNGYKVKPQFYVINFDDPRRSHRCNPIHPDFMIPKT